MGRLMKYYLRNQYSETCKLTVFSFCHNNILNHLIYLLGIMSCHSCLPVNPWSLVEALKLFDEVILVRDVEI